MRCVTAHLGFPQATDIVIAALKKRVASVLVETAAAEAEAAASVAAHAASGTGVQEDDPTEDAIDLPIAVEDEADEVSTVRTRVAPLFLSRPSSTVHEHRDSVVELALRAPVHTQVSRLDFRDSRQAVSTLV